MHDCNCDDDMTEDGHGRTCPNGIAMVRADLAAARAEVERLRQQAEDNPMRCAHGNYSCDPCSDAWSIERRELRARGDALATAVEKVTAAGFFEHAYDCPCINEYIEWQRCDCNLLDGPEVMATALAAWRGKP